jgi:RimJ/RimL family protein N-acetyltransferase
MTTMNEHGQPIGDPVPDWAPVALPDARTLPGRYCTLEHLDPDRHVDDLYAAYAAASDDRDWTYMPYGPFPTPRSYRDWAVAAAKSADPRHYAVIDNATGRALGTLSLMRHDPANGAIEVGCVAFSRALQRTPISTEAQYLLMRHVFDDLGYRRYEWKCDSLNDPSRKTAERLGFTYEGTFRQAVVYKGRNRDSA